MEKCVLPLVKIIIVNIVQNVKKRLVFAVNALIHITVIIAMVIVVNVQMENVKWMANAQQHLNIAKILLIQELGVIKNAARLLQIVLIV